MVVNMSSKCALILYLLCGLNILVRAFPEQGKWEFSLSGEEKVINVPKSLFIGSQIFIRMSCESEPPNKPIEIKWTLAQSPCWQDVQHSEADLNLQLNNQTRAISMLQDTTCSSNIYLDEYKPEEGKVMSAPASSTQNAKSESSKMPTAPDNSPAKKSNGQNPVYTIKADGLYLLRLSIFPHKKTDNSPFNVSVVIEMQGRYGYLSAADWPLLPFYGAMCLVYVIFGLAWLIVSFCQWRDLLRIQFWIGGVILLGMLEKATFYAEYQSINSTGVSVKGAMLLAELVSCGKRTLARMLVIIVSLGFGIVKPRLGPMLHRVVGTGLLYFTLAAIESYLRVMKPKTDPSNQILVASIPLAVLDSAICWWIFTSLVQTTRTLRLRRNLVKLALYRHFTNTLIFAVISSVIFMLYSIKYHHLTTCLTSTLKGHVSGFLSHLRLLVNWQLVIMVSGLYGLSRAALSSLGCKLDDVIHQRYFKIHNIAAVLSDENLLPDGIRIPKHVLLINSDDWKELWVDEAYWHLLFSVLLLVIMILWRPTNNNQRYAFTPLLDAPEDDEEEDEQFVNDAFGVKMRGYNRSNSPRPKSTNNVEDDLKWVEENIPTSLADTALTTMDSDEEIMTTKFEVSKMQ